QATALACREWAGGEALPRAVGRREPGDPEGPDECPPAPARGAGEEEGRLRVFAEADPTGVQAPSLLVMAVLVTAIHVVDQARALARYHRPWSQSGKSERADRRRWPACVPSARSCRSLPREGAGEEGQALVHAVVDGAVVVRELLVAVRHAEARQRAVQPA